MNREPKPKLVFNELNDNVLRKLGQLEQLNIEIGCIRDKFSNQEIKLRDMLCEFNMLSIQVAQLIEEIHRILPNVDNQCKLEGVRQRHQKQIILNQKLYQELLKKGFKIQGLPLTADFCNIQETVLNESSYSIQNNHGAQRQIQVPNEFTNNGQFYQYTLGNTNQLGIENQVEDAEERCRRLNQPLIVTNQYILPERQVKQRKCPPQVKIAIMMIVFMIPTIALAQAGLLTEYL